MIPADLPAAEHTTVAPDSATHPLSGRTEAARHVSDASTASAVHSGASAR